MKALVTRDMDGHYGVVIIENEEKELQVLQELMTQVVKDSSYFSDEEKAEAYKLANEGTIEEIKEWMDDGDLRMGRSGGGRIDIVDVSEKVPSKLVSDLVY